jgi:hypothetical protein
MKTETNPTLTQFKLNQGFPLSGLFIANANVEAIVSSRMSYSDKITAKNYLKII